MRPSKEQIRIFKTGATRDTDNNKLDFDGFLSPLTIQAYSEYLHKHRIQSNGELRDSDNWQKGISPKVYIKSAWRHFVALWALYRGYYVYEDEKKQTHILYRKPNTMPEDWWGAINILDSACGVLFNVSGFIHEILKKR